MHRSVDSAWIKTSVDGRATDAYPTKTATSAPGGARPGRSGVPQGAGVPSHPLSVGRTVAGGETDCHSQRIGEQDRSRANGGLSGNPVRAERAERERTPRVTARRCAWMLRFLCS